jgi:dihydropteroate synthase
VPVAEEIARVRPVIEALAGEATGVPISLDTRKAFGRRRGAAAGADILNDVSGLRFDPALADVAAAGRGAADPDAFHRHARNDAGAGGGRRL